VEENPEGWATGASLARAIQGVLSNAAICDIRCAIDGFDVMDYLIPDGTHTSTYFRREA
jgi:hypothetical protein